MTTTSDATEVPAGQTGRAGPGLTLNGAPASLDGVTSHTTLLDWLRDRGLTGAKEGCAEGECGACAVLVARPTPTDVDARPTGPEPTEWVAINACLAPVATLDGQEVVTVEGLGGPDHLHPVQHELASRGGSQCGYCTPGFVCAMAAEFYRPGRDDFDQQALSGNLCRCTGYRPIQDAAQALGAPDATDPLAARRAGPPPAPRHTRFTADGSEFVRPADLAEAVRLLVEHPDALVLAGSTDLGVDINLQGLRPSLIMAVDRLPELRGLQTDGAEIRIGAALTLTEMERGLAGRIPLLDQLFPQFASRLIRNAATLGSNLATASPVGDAAPVLLALEASVVLTGPSGDRVVPLQDFFAGYRQTVRGRDELIREITVPLPLAKIAAFHKVAKRRFDDISSVAVAFALDVVDGTVARARIGVGGVAATPIRARATEAALEGMPWSLEAPESPESLETPESPQTSMTPEAVTRAAALLAAEGTPMSDLRASDRYRRAMLEQSLLRLHVESTQSQEGRS